MKQFTLKATEGELSRGGNGRIKTIPLSKIKIKPCTPEYRNLPEKWLIWMVPRCTCAPNSRIIMYN